MTTRVEWAETVCGCGCGVTFRQLRDPGREREYLNNAHKQRAYRARNPHRSHSGTRKESASARQRREEQEAWAREEARRERERQRSYKRRTGRSPKFDLPDDCYPQPGDDAVKAEKRRLLRSVCEREQGTTFEGERETCRFMAEKLRSRYDLRV